MKKNDNRDIASDSKVNRCVGWVYDIVRNQSKPNVFLDKYIYPWATAVGNTVLYPNQINPPIQNNSTSNQPHQHSYSRSQTPSNLISWLDSWSYMGLAEVEGTSQRGRRVQNLERGMGLYMCCWRRCSR